MRIIIFLQWVMALAACSTPSQPGVTTSQAQVEEPAVVASPAMEWVASPWVPSYGATVDGPLPNILIIGDSISVQYTEATYDLLKDRYDVHHMLDNGRNSYYTRQ